MGRAAPPKVKPEPLQLLGYRVEINDDRPLMRIMFHTKTEKDVAYMVLDASDGYELAHKILRGYDKLEGIK
jgi:hypothetical protein